jgi:hypothetical protein
VPIIRGRSYHPQTQGSVEVANHTFKDRLYAEISESGNREWVAHLPEIAEVINTTRPSCLPAHVTPFEVWYGRKPRVVVASGSVAEASGSNDPPTADQLELEEAVEEKLFSELHKRVFAKNALEATKMVKKGGKKVEFEVSL